MLTFKKFLSIIDEDVAIDKMVIDIQTAISQIDNQINQRTQPLLAQKQQLQRRLGPILKKKQQEDAKTAKEQPQQGTNQQNPMLARTATTTPGSPGAATPGSMATSAPTR